MKRVMTFVMASLPTLACASPPAYAERFTHMAGVNLPGLSGMEHLQTTFGPSTVVETGDAAGSNARICYRATDRVSTVAFFQGEVDWGLEVHQTRPGDARCPVSAKLTSIELSAGGIRLGMNKTAFTQLIGKPCPAKAHRMDCDFSYIKTLTDDASARLEQRHRENGYLPENPEELRHWDVGIHIAATFKDRRLVSFEVTRVETN